MIRTVISGSSYLLRAVNIYSFFFHALPPEGGVLSLDELHYVVRDVWLARHDMEIEAERSARRKGRPKSTKEAKLEELQLREKELYRTGMGASFFFLPSLPFPRALHNPCLYTPARRT